MVLKPLFAQAKHAMASSKGQGERPRHPGPSKKRVSRRELLSRGLHAGAGLAAVGWVRPSISTINTTVQARPSPAGQPSIEVTKTVVEAIRDVSTLTLTGVITITDVSDAPVGFTVEEIRDVVEFRIGNQWQENPTDELVMPCPPLTQAPPEGRCSGDYIVQTVVPPNAGAARNVVHVKVFFRDKDFLYREPFDIPR
jgi:hypothetical protein